VRLRLENYHRLLSLVGALSWRDIASRYRGSTLGWLWTLLNPLLLLAVYALAFGYVFKAKWGDGNTSGDFVQLLFIGIAIHGFFAECLMRAPSVITANPSFVKKVVFPLGVLPATLPMVALFNLGAILLVFVLVRGVMGYWPGASYLLFPVLLMPMFLLALAMSYCLACLGVYFKDLNLLVPSLNTVLLFISSAIVPVASLPPEHQKWFYLNPITFYIDQARNLLLWDTSLDWTGLAVRLAISLVLLVLSVGLFRQARRGFADVI
jgi:lipopolysaccharide transport system permease protein